MLFIRVDKKIGLKIKKRRKALGITQIEAANKLGLTQGALSKCENGIPMMINYAAYTFFMEGV